MDEKTSRQNNELSTDYNRNNDCNHVHRVEHAAAGKLPLGVRPKTQGFRPGKARRQRCMMRAVLAVVDSWAGAVAAGRDDAAAAREV